MIEVVIPAYNAGRFLRETLHSVAAQTRLPVRVTVVDDASTDDTAAVLQACAVELADRIAIRLLDNTGPRGPSAARNTAIRASDATWIALLDADDLFALGHHEALCRAIDAAPDTLLAFGDSTVFREGRTVVKSYFAEGGVNRHPASEVAPDVWTLGDGMFPALLRHGIFATSACLVRREAALAAGLFDEDMMQCEDTDFFLRLAMAGRCVFIRAVIAHKRVHEDNLSHERHKLAFELGTVRSLSKLAARGDVSARYRDALDQALGEAVDGCLYHASRTSLPAYRDAVRLARQAHHGGKAASPRHLARLMWNGLR